MYHSVYHNGVILNNGNDVTIAKYQKVCRNKPHYQDVTGERPLTREGLLQAPD